MGWRKPVRRKRCPIARALMEARHRNSLRLRLRSAILDGHSSPGDVLALRLELKAEEERADAQIRDSIRARRAEYFQKMKEAGSWRT
jgi:hypothetical protein